MRFGSVTNTDSKITWTFDRSSPNWTRNMQRFEQCTCMCVRVHLVLKFSNVKNHVNECGFKTGQVNTAAAMFESCFAF